MTDDVPQKTVNFQILSENHLKLHVNVRPQIHKQKLNCQIKGGRSFSTRQACRWRWGALSLDRCIVVIRNIQAQVISPEDCSGLDEIFARSIFKEYLHKSHKIYTKSKHPVVLPHFPIAKIWFLHDRATKGTEHETEKGNVADVSVSKMITVYVCLQDIYVIICMYIYICNLFLKIACFFYANKHTCTPYFV